MSMVMPFLVGLSLGFMQMMMIILTQREKQDIED
jgi:hypothetical protein